tara:strand:- start:12832 stop:14091 length:1260 start_codon:yes stop_codon:yes gene_type:complete
MKRTLITFSLLLTVFKSIFSFNIILEMNHDQNDHLKAYGVAYNVINSGNKVEWLLNHEGGSFMFNYSKEIENECKLKGVSYKIIPQIVADKIRENISKNEVNKEIIVLEKAPKIAIYSPKNKQPWDDAVTLALSYSEIPYDIIYDQEVLNNLLPLYDWLHLHHEDFTGQYGKFYSAFKNASWYLQQKKEFEIDAKKLGYSKVSDLKLEVAKKIKEYVFSGGFLFAMCSATDSYDIALSSENIDICHDVFDYDPIDSEINNKLNFDKTLAFKDFSLITNPNIYEFSNIDATRDRKVKEKEDFFILFEFSAKWDQVPTMLCQNHEKIIKGFMGQTTSFKKKYIKKNVIVLAENKSLDEVKYIHGKYGNGTWTFYGGHDPEDYQHRVGDPKTDLSLHPNSPGYRLILNNILFPAAKKKKQKT